MTDINIPLSLLIDREDALSRDFTVLIPELNKAGFSNNNLAIKVDCSEGAIRKWAKGDSIPDYIRGAQLVVMHMIYCAPAEPALKCST